MKIHQLLTAPTIKGKSTLITRERLLMMASGSTMTTSNFTMTSNDSQTITMFGNLINISADASTTIENKTHIIISNTIGIKATFAASTDITKIVYFIITKLNHINRYMANDKSKF